MTLSPTQTTARLSLVRESTVRSFCAPAQDCKSWVGVFISRRGASSARARGRPLTAVYRGAWVQLPGRLLGFFALTQVRTPGWAFFVPIGKRRG